MKHEIIKTSADAISIGETFYKSGMFADIKSAQQAVVKIMAGAEMGISPFQAMSGIHIIQGKPTIGAGLMASRVKASGKYNYKVLEMTDKVWKMQAKKFGAQAIRTGESMVNMLTGSLNCLESQSYVNSCDYVRQRVDEINLEISPTD